MNDAVSKQPTLDEQIAVFKGFSTVDGEIKPDKPAEKPEATPEKAPTSAQERLAAARAPAKAAKADNSEEIDDSESEEADEQAEKADSPEQKPDSTAKKPANGAQERINKAVGRQRAAERDRDMAVQALRALESRFSALEARISGDQRGAPLTQQRRSNEDAAPDASKYEYGELDTKYIADLARYEARQQLRDAQTQYQQQSQAAQQAQAAQQRETALRTFESSGLAKYEDFTEVVVESANAGEWPLSPVVGELVLGSEYGPDIAYFLATHPDEARRLADLPQAKQAAWFGQQEALLSSQSSGAGARNVPLTTKAPPLPSARARGTGSRTQVSADTTDFAAFEAMARGQQR